ncbi:MAG: TIGR02147 family protein [Bdellovibrionota bacterium]
MLNRSNYINILKERLADRIKRNSRYSLRAFAKDINMSPGRLSNVLNGKSGLSLDKASTIAQKLDLSEAEAEWFITSVQSQDARSKTKRSEAQRRINALKKTYKDYQQLNLDQFALISEWYHFALIDLMDTKDFKNDTQWMAKRLGISKVEVEVALSRLKSLNFIKEEKNKLSVLVREPSTPSNIPSAAIKLFHRQILEKAITAIDMQSVEERDFSAITMPISKDIMEEAQIKIKNFRREFDKWAQENSKNKKDVYCISIQFFNLTNNQ